MVTENWGISERNENSGKCHYLYAALVFAAKQLLVRLAVTKVGFCLPVQSFYPLLSHLQKASVNFLFCSILKWVHNLIASLTITSNCNNIIKNPNYVHYSFSWPAMGKRTLISDRWGIFWLVSIFTNNAWNKNLTLLITSELHSSFYLGFLNSHQFFCYLIMYKQISKWQLRNSSKGHKYNSGWCNVDVKYKQHKKWQHFAIAEGEQELGFEKNHVRNSQRKEILTRNSSLIKYLALVTLGSSPGSGVAD